MSISRRSFASTLLALTAWQVTGCHAVSGVAGDPVSKDKTGPPAGPAEPGIRDLPSDPEVVTPITRTDAEWKALLPPEAYRILRESGTERAFSGHYWDNHAVGRYACAGCGLTLFRSEDKFESGTGWPSFTQPIVADRLKVATDNTLGMSRDEVACARCSGHMGHVFNDGPAPTGLRYCMNSWSLVFRAA